MLTNDEFLNVGAGPRSRVSGGDEGGDKNQGGGVGVVGRERVETGRPRDRAATASEADGDVAADVATLKDLR